MMRRGSGLLSSAMITVVKQVEARNRFIHHSPRVLQSTGSQLPDSLITTHTSNTTSATNGNNSTATSVESTPASPTIFDTEKEMFQIRRKMTAAYSLGKYQLALQHALDLESKATQIMGKRNAVYASCLNNVALMYKMLGEQEAAMDKYTDALHVYMDVTGKNHVSYAATLANLGVLYKDMSKGRVVSRNNSDDTGNEEGEVVVVPVKGMEKLQLLERAEEALVEARDTRISLLGKSHKDTIHSTIHLASLWKMRSANDKAKLEEAQRMLEEALTVAQETYSDADIICGSLHNDLGVLYKGKALHDQALLHYTKALEIRSKVLGDTHNDTVVTVYNLAELHTAMGNSELATSLQETLVTTLQARDGANTSNKDKDHATTTASFTAARSSPAVDERATLRERLELNVQKNNTVSAPPLPATEVEKMNVADIVARDLGNDSTGTRVATAGAAVGASEAPKKAPPQTFASRTNKPATRRKPASTA